VKTGLGCAAYLAVLAAVVIGVDQLTSGHLPRELRFFVAMPAGLLVTVGLSNLWTLVRAGGPRCADRSPASSAWCISTGIETHQSLTRTCVASL
jgi:hypothetical protein